MKRRDSFKTMPWQVPSQVTDRGVSPEMYWKILDRCTNAKVKAKFQLRNRMNFEEI